MLPKAAQLWFVLLPLEESIMGFLHELILGTEHEYVQRLTGALQKLSI